MKIRVIADIDLDTGSYEMSFDNLTHPGSQIEYHRLRTFLQRAFAHVDAELTEDVSEFRTGPAPGSAGTS